MKYPIAQVVRKPLAAFRWPLKLLLVGFWVALTILANSCAPEPSYYGVALATASVCIALWANHLSMAPIKGVKNALRLVGIALYDFGALGNV
jgi:hypothetical protein